MNRAMKAFLKSAVVSSLLVAAACGSNNNPAQPPAPGFLALTVSGLPNGVDANVVLTDSAGKIQRIVEARTSLPPGDYALNADPVQRDGSTYHPVVSAPRVTIVSSQTSAASVDYELVRGALRVNISGLPAGLAASVVVSGPQGFAQTLSSSQTLGPLIPGDYTLQASNVVGDVYVYEAVIAGSPASVASGETATASTTYAISTTPGMLQVTSSGLQDSSLAQFTITGPNGFRQTFRGNRTLVLPAGRYSVSADPVRIRQPIVDQIFISPAGIATVLPRAQASLDFSFSRRQGSGMLWLNPSGLFMAFDQSQLAAGGYQWPPTILFLPSVALIGGTAFASDGSVWATSTTIIEHQIVQYVPAQFLNDPTPSIIANVTITAPDNGFLFGSAFDSQGALWVSAEFPNQLMKYTAAQLTSSGSPQPAVTITGNGPSSEPAIAFDFDGNLWVSNGVARSLVKYTSDQLAASGNPSPAITLSDQNGSLSDPRSLAFDEDGNLWVANYSSNTIVKFTPDQLARSGAPVPGVILTANNQSLNEPACVAFDNAGSLWVGNAANMDNRSLVKFSPEQLAQSGNPTPAVALRYRPYATFTRGCAFDPPPTSLPLSH